ncbi:hypothetical protein [Marinobacter sp. C2H3]|uniref:hypothetical protein n=1 Tax=Marinobacter sp. C2H3 TaxID=3119003 RepID=UPI00300ED03C
MTGKVLLALAVVASTVTATSVYLMADNDGRFAWGHAGTAAPPAVAAPTTTTLQQSTPAAPAPLNPETAALGAALSVVADQYEQTVRYPPYSIPLTPAQAAAYDGNTYHPVGLPLEGGGHFTVSLDRYRFTRGDDIVVVATLDGPQVVGQTLTATLEHQPDRKTAGSARLTATGDGYFEGVLSSDEDPGEYHLIVEAQVDGQPVRHASTLTIEPELGDFGGLDDPYVSNNNLVIPVEFSPDHSGTYALSAQLYNGTTPIAQLQEEQAMSSGKGTFKLRAHGTVLANQTVSGQLQLRNLMVRELPERPGDRTHYGYGPEDGYRFTPPDLDALSDTPAANPESALRAQMLRQLAGKFR